MEWHKAQKEFHTVGLEADGFICINWWVFLSKIGSLICSSDSFFPRSFVLIRRFFRLLFFSVPPPLSRSVLCNARDSAVEPLPMGAWRAEESRAGRGYWLPSGEFNSGKMKEKARTVG